MFLNVFQSISDNTYTSLCGFRIKIWNFLRSLPEYKYLSSIPRKRSYRAWSTLSKMAMKCGQLPRPIIRLLLVHVLWGKIGEVQWTAAPLSYVISWVLLKFLKGIALNRSFVSLPFLSLIFEEVKPSYFFLSLQWPYSKQSVCCLTPCKIHSYALHTTLHAFASWRT